MLPTDHKARKAVPLYSGVLRYFPRALSAIAQLSQVGNDQHNPGEPLHWAKGKSQDELDACIRHLLEAGKIDTDKVRHSTKGAWRALANLEKELEADELGISVEELNARYKAEEARKAAKIASRDKAKARKAKSRAKKAEALEAAKAQLAVAAKMDAEDDPLAKYADRPCVEIELGKLYRVVDVKFPCSRSRIGQTFLAGTADAGNGLTNDGYRLFYGSYCRLAPV